MAAQLLVDLDLSMTWLSLIFWSGLPLDWDDGIDNAEDSDDRATLDLLLSNSKLLKSFLGT